MLKKFGQDLQKIRESKKITIADISGKTKIHKTILEKMENGDFSFFSATHIRAFLKQYAKAVGLNSDDILFNYEMAKNGKYSSMIEDIIEKEKEAKDVESKINYVEEPELPNDIEIKKEDLQINKTESDKKETLNDIFEIPTTENNISEKKEIKQDLSGNDDKMDAIERKPFSKSKRIKLESEKGEFTGKYTEDKGFHIPSNLLKNAGIFLLIIVLLFGVYLLIDVVFLQKHGSKTEIIKQNFDDVVKETEKKVLGKRSEEEIKDSLNKALLKADSLRRIQNDSITLKIVGINSGSLTVVTDTLTEGNKYTESFEKGAKGEWKAKNKFYLTSKNTESFVVFLNDKKLEISDKKVNKLKITKQGITK